MRAHRFLAPLILAGLAAGCGGSTPSTPSTVTPPTSVGPAATQGIVAATLTQAASAVVTAAPDGSKVITYPCPSGGSMTMTINVTTPAGLTGTLTSSTRTDFNDCRSQTVTMTGDPYLMIAGEHVFVRGADGVLSSVTGTIRITGGLRVDDGGTQGRARYDCTQVMSVQIVNGTPSQPSITSSGTITWEQPLGTVTVRPCGL